MKKKKIDPRITLLVIFLVSVAMALVTINMLPKPTPEQARKIMEANKKLTEMQKKDPHNRILDNW